MRLYPKSMIGLAISTALYVLSANPVPAEEPTPPVELLTLQEAVETALSHHPSLLAARGNLQVQQALVGEARSNYFPQLDLQGNYTRATANTSTSVQSSQALAVARNTPKPSNTAYNNYAASLSLQQRIFDFGKTIADVESARESMQGSDLNRQDIRQAVAVNVKVAFYGLLQARRLVQVQEETVNQFKEHLEQVEGFYRAGTRTRYDVTTAEVNLTNAQLDLIKARNAEVVARVTLANAMGEPDRTIGEMEDLLGFKKVEMSENQAIQEALAKRPDLMSLEAQRRSAAATIRSARRSYFPVLSGVADYNWRGQDYPLVWNWDAGFVLTIPLFSGYLTESQVAQARANMIVADANKEVLRQNVILEVHQVFANLKEAEERVQTAEVVLRQAEENLELANGRFQAGVGTTVEQTDAQVLLTNAKTSRVQALYDYRVAAAQLQKAMGRME